MSHPAARSSTTGGSFVFPPLYSFKPFFTSDNTADTDGPNHRINTRSYASHRLTSSHFIRPCPVLSCSLSVPSVQPIEASWSKQRSVWLELIRSYSEHHRLYRFTLHSYHANTTTTASSTASSTTTPTKSTRESQLLHVLFRNDEIDRQLSLDAIRILLDALAADSYGVWEDVAAGPNRNSFLLSPVHRFHEIGDHIWAHLESIGETTSIVTLYELQHGDLMKKATFASLDEHILLAALRTLETRGKCTIIPSGVISETGIKFLGS